MRSVFKYQLTNTPTTTVLVPGGGTIRDVATQHGMPTVWIEVDPDDTDTWSRTFTAYGTGHEIPDDDEDVELRFVGTCHDVAGAGLVFHIYERIARP